MVLSRVGRLDLGMRDQFSTRLECQDNVDLFSDREFVRQAVQLYRKPAWVKLELSDRDIDRTDSSRRKLRSVHNDAQDLCTLSRAGSDVRQPDRLVSVFDIHEDQG